jgi:tRNA(fMet)-specific endonuclease VapC
MEYLLDTNICIYIIKERPLGVINKFKSLPLGSIGISAITLAELQYGIMKSSKTKKNKDALNKFITPLEILDFDYNATIEYGKVRQELEKKGMPIGPLDTLIAAHARSNKLTLVTNNEREFKRVSNLKIENWVKQI